MNFFYVLVVVLVWFLDVWNKKYLFREMECFFKKMELFFVFKKGIMKEYLNKI